MTGVSYFEIAGELIELKADIDYATSKSTASERTVQRKMAKDVRIIGKVPKMVFPDPSGEEMGTYETIGNAVGLVAGVYFGVVTFPVTQVDSPLIGPADLAWFGATIRFTQKAQAGGRLIGRQFD
jgi:hypothetical protein